MPWYKTGTVKTTINSNAIIGTGTAFISNSRVGDAFRGPDGNWYEVVNIASDTAMSISPNYQGSTVAAGTYSIAPMQGYVKESADALRAASRAIGNVSDDLSEQIDQAIAAATESKGYSESALSYSNSAQIASQLASSERERAEASAIISESSSQSSAASAILAEGYAEEAKSSSQGRAASGANSDITSLSGLTTPLSISQGGTGGNTAPLARTALGLGTASTYSVDGVGGIIESGSTANGEYTKLIDGTLICRLPIKQTTFETKNVLRYMWSFPSPFLAGTVPNTSISIHGIIGIARPISGAVPSSPTPTSITLDIYSNGQFYAGDEVNAQVSAVAIGRWKA